MFTVFLLGASAVAFGFLIALPEGWRNDEIKNPHCCETTKQLTTGDPNDA